MTQLLDTVIAFFEGHEWPVQRRDDASVLLTGFRGKNGSWPCLAWTNEEEEQFVFYSRQSSPVPEDKRLLVAEYVTRANYNMIFGNFELDLDDGEVRFKTSISVRKDRLTTALVESVVIANVMMMDRYMPGMIKVVNGEASPKEAIAEIESS